MGLTVTTNVKFPYAPGILGSHRVGICNIAFDSSYPTGGEAITAANLNLFSIKTIIPFGDDSGYSVKFDRANLKLKVYVPDLSAGSGTPSFAVSTGTVTDDDNAATAGTDVLIVPELNGVMGYLESTNAGNADSVAAIGNGGPVVNINDNDSPGSIVLYFDEDATAPDSKFLCISPTGADVFVPVSDGSFLRIAHDASADSTGVAVHFDDNAANNYERLLFISPTDADATYTTDDTVGNKLEEAEAVSDAAMAEVANTTNLAALSSLYFYVGV